MAIVMNFLSVIISSFVIYITPLWYNVNNSLYKGTSQRETHQSSQIENQVIHSQSRINFNDNNNNNVYHSMSLCCSFGCISHRLLSVRWWKTRNVFWKPAMPSWIVTVCVTTTTWKMLPIHVMHLCD